LNISVSSVKASVSHIMEVLQVGSRKEAGVKARYSQLQ
jgi:DNA-binding NarL/FixJ family response regulator